VRVLSTFLTGLTVEKLSISYVWARTKEAYPSPISPSFIIVPLVFCLSLHVDFPEAGLAVGDPDSTLPEGVSGDDPREAVRWSEPSSIGRDIAEAFHQY
jgi:hypothetical protein